MMASSTYSDLFDGADAVAVAEGTYDVEVTASRTLPGSRLVFLDLKVIAGPLADTVAQVNLYVPDGTNRGAGHYFRQKVAGFAGMAEVSRQMDSADDIATVLNILADALVGQKVTAEVETVSDGNYAGTNQLKSTKPSDAAAAPTPAAATAPAPAAPVSPATAEPAAVVVEDAAAALDAEVPF